MLRLCTKSEFELYIDFSYELATCLEKSAYPTYCDGIKTKEMFVERLGKVFDRENEEILLFECEGKVEGLIHYYWIPEDNYIATSGFNINKATEQAMSEFLAFVGEQFKGYDLFLGFPAENKSAVEYLAGQGFECIENNYNNTAFIDKIKDLPKGNRLIRIEKENYERFKTLHDQIEGDMYWNSERIFGDLDKWSIFVAEKEGRSQGAVYYTDVTDDWFEIFGVDMNNGEFDQDIFRNLLYAALSDVKRRGGRVMTFFCDKESEQVVLECGFTYVGNYLCYKTHLE
ncbi:hypothetical protein [Acetivibrio ethanolgignens]|uniref:N-acetyltransferase domain-containing protein n=1 Tax=Acetivibrio ethanolgignens TaxID=290052 RepID=A0A0V8QDA8_9FIRM|nr:hypothetical protein [Acetivibrio ethanolgignens]KSV58519.1 hypothetical protein ASU35_12440 [Acetivibrio ethanolgignens]